MKRKKDKKLAYKIACMNCNKCYIGETRREKSTRMKEHQKDINKMADSSNIVKHITEYKHGFNLIRLKHYLMKTIGSAE